ncbi:MAG: DUF373 family protein [Candidatus Thermoplasmatota archaeon]|nr:DUF373 family protein [Candidatus Thermoplasmatota archaeon]
MKTLVLCVDRDNDIGVKADVQGPVIGRQPNLDAAMTLGLADSEDADVNTILMAVAMYDELVKSGMDAEVATIAGDPHVGHQSDTILSHQLDEVLEKVAPDHAYLVSDGAEDESVFPMIASRVKINHVKRVYVKQSPSVESAFYIAAKAMRDERLRRRIVLPIALSLVALAVVLIYNPAIALPAVLFVLGLYLLVRAYDEFLSPRKAWKRFVGFYASIKESLTSGRVGVWFTLVAIVIFLVAFFVGWQAATPRTDNILIDAVVFFESSFWIFILAFLLHEGGRVAEAYFTKGKIARSFFYVALALFVLILVIGAGIQFISTVLELRNPQTALTLIYIESALAISIVLVAAFLHRSGERGVADQDAWRP